MKSWIEIYIGKSEGLRKVRKPQSNIERNKNIAIHSVFIAHKCKNG